MDLASFLRLHDGGVACVSITSVAKKGVMLGKRTRICEEESQEEILESEWFEKVADKEVIRFCVIGGGSYKVELCIEVADEIE